MKIERTKQPDRLNYIGNGFEIETADYISKGGSYLRIQTYRAREIYLSTTEAKELSKVLPKFLEEMER